MKRPRSSLGSAAKRIGNKEPILCPSAKAKEGAILLGIVKADGQIGYFEERISINKEFMDIATRGRSPEKRFRFSSPCATKACMQWNVDRCGVIDSAVDAFPVEGSAELPSCSIRPNCRWFRQHGEKACSVCPLIITDISDVPNAIHLSKDFKQVMISEAVGTAL